MHPPEQAVHPLKRFSIKTQYLFHVSTQAMTQWTVYFLRISFRKPWYKPTCEAVVSFFESAASQTLFWILISRWNTSILLRPPCRTIWQLVYIISDVYSWRTSLIVMYSLDAILLMYRRKATEELFDLPGAMRQSPVHPSKASERPHVSIFVPLFDYYSTAFSAVKARVLKIRERSVKLHCIFC